MSWFDQRPDDAMMGSFEAYAPDHITTVDPLPFREAMSQLGAAVHVVTTAGPAGIAGFTATVVVSVSDQPATLLVCLNRRSQVAPILQENRLLAVNTVSLDHYLRDSAFSNRNLLQLIHKHGLYPLERMRGDS